MHKIDFGKTKFKSCLKIGITCHRENFLYDKQNLLGFMQFNWGLRVTEKKLYITSNF